MAGFVTQTLLSQVWKTAMKEVLEMQQADFTQLLADRGLLNFDSQLARQASTNASATFSRNSLGITSRPNRPGSTDERRFPRKAFESTTSAPPGALQAELLDPFFFVSDLALQALLTLHHFILLDHLLYFLDLGLFVLPLPLLQDKFSEL